MSDIHHHLIHAHAAEDRTAFAVNEHRSFVGKRARIAVCITDGDRGDTHILIRDVGMAVADSAMCFQRLDMGNVCDQFHGRTEIKASVRFLPHVLGGIEPVKDDALADHIVIAVKGKDAGAVIEVTDRNIHALFVKHRQKTVEKRALLDGGNLIECIREGEMAEDAFQRNMGKLCRYHRFFCFLIRDTEADTRHTRVDTEMHACRFSKPACRFGKDLDRFELKHRHRDVMCERRFKQMRRGVSEDQNRRLDPRAAELQCFVHFRNAEIIRFLFKTFCNRHRAMSVSIRFDNQHQTSVLGDFLFDERDVVCNGIQVDLRVDSLIFHDQSFSVARK